MVAPSYSLFVAGHSHAQPCIGSISNGRIESAQESHAQRRHDKKASSNQTRASSSGLDIRPRPTPGSYLDFSSTQQASGRDGLPSHEKKPSSPPPPTQVVGVTPGRPSSSKLSHGQHGSSQSDTATFRGKNYRASRQATDGKICLHTHHHHYWIVSDPAQLEETIPRLRPSKKRMPLQQSDANSRFDGHMDCWPNEADVEILAESRRLPSRNTNHRYFIEG